MWMWSQQTRKTPKGFELKIVIFVMITCVSFRCFAHRNIAAPVRGPATNNRGEIQAATRAIYAAGNYGLDNIRIITDSHFLYDSVTDGWLDVWRDLDWTKTNGRPLANERDFQALDRALARNWHMNIEWEHVYAHSGDEGNDEADRLAKEGAQIYQDLYC